MRIVVLNWRDRQHPAAGGAELYCERVARELAAEGHDITLVTSRPTGLAAREDVDGYRVRRFGGWMTVYPLALLWLARHLRGVDAVVDSANGIPFFSPLVARSTPVVLLVHHVHQDLFTSALSPRLARLGQWLEGPATRAVYGRRTVVVLSPSTRAAVRRRLHLRGPVHVVPGGADTAGAVVERAPRPRVVVVGRLSRYKRLDTLVAATAQAAQRVEGLELHLVGGGQQRGVLEALARELDAPVVFHGRLCDADRDAVLASAWLTVSASDSGDWSLRLLEANAAGVPALARRVSGFRDTVRHDESGWLVEEPEVGDDVVPHLAHALVSAVQRLEDPHTALEVSRSARAWALRFSWSRAAEGVLAALRSEGLRASQARSEGDRRTGNDVSVVIELPREVLPAAWDPRNASTRRDDRWIADERSVRALLPGADEQDALALLRRLAVDPDHPGISVLVARHADVVAAARETPGGIVVA